MRVEKKDQVRITSDGTPFGTQVFVVAADGTATRLETVSRVAWKLDVADGHAVAQITIHDVEVDVLAFVGDSSMALAGEPDAPCES